MALCPLCGEQMSSDGKRCLSCGYNAITRKDGKRRASGSPRWLAVVVAVSDDRCAMANKISGNMVCRIGKFLAHSLDHLARLFHASRRR